RLQTRPEVIIQSYQGQAQPRVGDIPLTFKVTPRVDGAWWTDTALVQRLGLTDDQKAKIEHTYENHRDRIVSSTTTLEQEETKLSQLLAADTVDRNAVLAQI